MEAPVEKIRRIASLLAASEGGPLKEGTVEEILSLLGGIKKEASGLKKVREVLSILEKLLEAMKGKEMNYEISETIFKALDNLAVCFERGSDVVDEGIVSELRSLVGGEKEEEKTEDELFEIFKGEALDLLSKIENGLEALRDGFSEELAKELMRCAHTVKGSSRLVGIKEITELSHSLENLFLRAIQEKKPLGEKGVEVALSIKDAIENLVLGGGVEWKKVEELKNKALEVELGESKEEVHPVYTFDEGTVRISLKKLEMVSEKAIELKVHAKKNLELEDLLKKLESRLRNLGEKKGIDKGLLKGLEEVFSHVKRVFYELHPSLEYRIDELLDRVEGLRMFPFRIVSSLLPKMVREAASELGKRVRFVVEGEEVEVEKSVLEKLREPLIHLIRNAVDHGIETPEERRKKGKPEEGFIRLSIFHKGDELWVQVEDDGRGIDLEKVKEKAREKGLGLEGDPLDLLFLPGFTTRDKAGEFSGRGYGLDIVKKVVEELGGRIFLETEKDKGTRVSMALPLKRFLIKVLVASVGGVNIAIPTRNVVGLRRIKEGEVRVVEGMSYIEARGEGVEVFNLSGDELEPGRLNVLILEHKRIFGIVVDRIVGVFDLVVKFLKDGGFVVGRSVLPNGEVVQVVDVGRMLDFLRKKRRVLRFREKEAPRVMRVLVADDSLTTRVLMKMLLEGEGFEVDLAGDGMEALEKLGEKEYQLALIDVDMPKMDGFTLTERMKKSRRYRGIPVIILTSKGDQKDLKRGLEVGADAYFVKGRFDRKEFLETVRRFL